VATSISQLQSDAVAIATRYLSVVIPIHNGVERLPRTLDTLGNWLGGQTASTELVLVDDGSAPPVAELLQEFGTASDGVQVLINGRNRGKGHAVARGMLAATGQHRVFMDADLAYPIEETRTIVDALEAGSDVAIACRVLPESRYLIAPTFFRYLYTRLVMSRLFNWAVRHTLVRGILDTQAGLKGFTAEAAAALFPRLTIPGFGFDVELLFLAQRLGLRVAQVPVHFRYDSEPSTLRFTRDGMTMLGDLARIRWNDWRGRYR
jgi:dolichyl-phosphate beta-glucosyltransferase